MEEIIAINLIELSGKQVKRGEDATIGTKAVLLHHILIPHSVTNINVGPKWQSHHRRVKVDDVAPLI